MNGISSFILAAVLSCSGCSALSGSDGVVVGRYKDYANAVDSGVFEHGWLPQQIPKSATNIEEIHVIDSGEVWIRFEYDERDISLLTDECRPDSSITLPDARRSTTLVVWWPSVLTNGAARDSLSSWTLYSCPRMKHAASELPAGLALDRSADVAFYWRVR